MLKKRTKIIILVAMVLLLGVTGYLNIALNNRVVDAGANNVSAYNYFDSYRSERAAERDKEISILDAIISSAESSEEAITNAQSAKLAITKQMEQDLALEFSIKGLGYSDAIVTTSNSYINVIVKASEMTDIQANQILKLVVDGSTYDVKNIKIIPIE